MINVSTASGIPDRFRMFHSIRYPISDLEYGYRPYMACDTNHIHSHETSSHKAPPKTQTGIRSGRVERERDVVSITTVYLSHLALRIDDCHALTAVFQPDLIFMPCINNGSRRDTQRSAQLKYGFKAEPLSRKAVSYDCLNLLAGVT